MTKVMTMLLIMEALESGKINLEEKVNISNNAASMGGSQVFLEAGSQLSVKELLKSIAIASAMMLLLLWLSILVEAPKVLLK